MDQPSMKYFRIGVAVGAVGLVCSVLATALDYWFYRAADGNMPKIYFGLWETCATESIDTVETKACKTWADVEKASQNLFDIKWLHACQAFMIIADICLGLGVIFGAMFVITYKSNKRIQLAAGVLCIAAGVCALIAAIVFAAKYKSEIPPIETIDGNFLHAGFGLAIVAALLSASGGVLVLMNKTIFTSSCP